MTDALTPSHRLKRMVAELKKNGAVPPVTTREFLSWFGARRRGFWVVAGIRRELHDAGLETFPDFQSNYIDAPLGFKLLESASSRSQATKGAPAEHAAEEVESPETLEFDAPSYRVSRLEAANKKLVSAKPDTTLREAMTLMMMNDFSQLPVMTSDREVKGIVSWASIGARVALGKQLSNGEQYVRDFMEPHHEIRITASLFSAIDVIVQQQYVLVRGTDQRITGIVTATDLSLQFRQLTEPFLLLGEVENHLRKLLAARFTQTEIEAACAEGDRKVDGVADLTFGEYQRLLEDPATWRKLGLNLDRATFCRKLDKVREIRNDVMHFDPDGVDPSDLRELREFAQFLRLLDGVSAPDAVPSPAGSVSPAPSAVKKPK